MIFNISKPQWCLFFLLAGNFLFAQPANNIASESITIFGKKINSKIIALADLQNYPSQKIENQIILNHSGETKDTLKNLKVIDFKKVLQSIDFGVQKPKELNEFYFIFSATDGYKVVFSWNEIFNTEVGNHLYIVAEMNGKKISELADRIMLLSTYDTKLGRRYIKALEKIEIKRAE